MTNTETNKPIVRMEPLMPIIISKITGKRYPNTKEGRAQLDRDEGRERLNNSGIESLVALQACDTVGQKAYASIDKFVKKTGAGKMLKAQIAGMRKSLRDIMSKVSVSQIRTLQANTQLVNITVTSSRVPAMVNIDVEDLTHICNRALEMCAFSCACTREESKECRLRQALEQVASSCVEAVRSDPTKCPYAGTSFEAELDMTTEGGE